jgi:hypothetical protein
VSAVYAPGVLPLNGDQVRITERVAPTESGDRWLTVEWARPCDDPTWAHLTGRWDDGRPGHAMVWLDRIVVRRAGEPAASTG